MLDCRQIFILATLVCLSKAKYGGYQYPPPEQYPPIDSAGLTPNGPDYGHEVEHGGFGYQSIAASPNHEEYNTDFYAFEAPYDSIEDSAHIEQHFTAALRKNLQVVFIKAPENKVLEGAFTALAKQSAEDKTAIYVLNKQNDASELASKLSALRLHHNSKPEVHFVKYRTPEEAAYAQQHIQAHYRSLPGSEQHSQGETAPTLNYASAATQAGGVTSGSALYGGAFGGAYGGSQAPTASAGDLELANFANNVDTSSNDLNALDAYGQAAYDLENSQKVNIMLNERFRTGSKMVFPSEEPTKLHNAYLPPYKKRH